MPTLFEKLNLKDRKVIIVLDAPKSFEPELQALEGVVVVKDINKVEEVTFGLAFAEKKIDLDRVSMLLTSKAKGDAILWFAYPKGTSKNYHSDFNRDTGWEVLFAAGFRPVRQVAIDDDWSALRFRRNAFVKPVRQV